MFISNQHSQSHNFCRKKELSLTKVLTYEHTPTAERPMDAHITVSHAPTTTKNPTYITVMASPKRRWGISHAVKILTEDVTVKLNANVTALIFIHSMLLA